MIKNGSQTLSKVIFLVSSFLIGIFIFLPYDKIYTILLEKQINKYRLPITFKIKNASPFNITFLNIAFIVKDGRFEIRDVVLSANPIKYIIHGSIALISGNGVKINILKEDNLFKIYFDIDDFSNKFLEDKVIFIDGYAYLDNITKKEKRLQLNINNIKIIKPLASEQNILLNDIKGNFVIKDNNIDIENLTINGMINLNINGRMSLDANDLMNSHINLLVQGNNIIGKNQLELTLKDAADWFKALIFGVNL